eukprot:7293162-Pyramimonas_sp.AAC.1
MLAQEQAVSYRVGPLTRRAQNLDRSSQLWALSSVHKPSQQTDLTRCLPLAVNPVLFARGLVSPTRGLTLSLIHI